MNDNHTQQEEKKIIEKQTVETKKKTLPKHNHNKRHRENRKITKKENGKKHWKFYCRASLSNEKYTFRFQNILINFECYVAYSLLCDIVLFLLLLSVVVALPLLPLYLLSLFSVCCRAFAHLVFFDGFSLPYRQ